MQMHASIICIMLKVLIWIMLDYFILIIQNNPFPIKGILSEDENPEHEKQQTRLLLF